MRFWAWGVQPTAVLHAWLDKEQASPWKTYAGLERFRLNWTQSSFCAQGGAVSRGSVKVENALVFGQS